LKAGLNQDGKFKIALKEDRGPIVLTEINQNETGLIAKGSIPGTTNFYSIFLTPQLDVFENQNILNFFYRGNAKPFHMPEPGGLIGISALNDSFISINTMTDAFLFNMETKKIEKVFSEGKKINNVYQDSEENLWFTTLGNGVYRLDKNRISNFSFGEDAKPVFCIHKIDSLIYIGSDNFNIFSLNPKKGKIERIHINNQQGRGRVTTLLKIKPNNIVAGTDAGLFDIFPKLNKRNKRGFAVKDAFGTDDGSIIASTSYNVSRIIPHKFDGLETIWKMRSTAIFQTNKTLYIGTLNGLYTIDSKKDSV
jgi:ligand-binding sensor domain-containing protein